MGRTLSLMASLLLIAGSLAACGQESEAEGKAEADAGENTAENAEEVPVLSDEEAKDIVVDTLHNIEEIMVDLQMQEFEDAEGWNEVDWDDPDSDPDVYDQGLSVTKEALEPYIAEKALEDRALHYLTHYFNYLEGLANSSDNVGVRFQIIEQDADFFSASYLFLETDAGYHEPGTIHVSFLKDDGNWKLEEEVFTSAEDQPLDLTMDDIEEDVKLYRDDEPQVDKLGETEEAGTSYIIYEIDDYVEARNVKTSELAYEVADAYRELEEAESGEAVDENEDSSRSEYEAGDYSNLTDYDTNTMEETTDWIEISVSYPTFGIEVLDHELESMTSTIYDEYVSKQSDMEEGAKEMGIPFSSIYTFDEVVLTDDYASVLFSESKFEGGVHPNNSVEPFNYALKKGDTIEIKDVLDGDQGKLETLAQIVQDDLKGRDDLFQENVQEATEPDWDNFSNFFLTEDAIIIMYQPYEVGPYASGVVRADVPFAALQ